MEISWALGISMAVGSQIVHETCRRRLAIAIVDKFFQQRAADSLGQAAGHLPFNDHRIDLSAHVFGNQIVKNFQNTGLPVHFHHRDVDAIGKGPFVGGEKVFF